MTSPTIISAIEIKPQLLSVKEPGELVERESRIVAGTQLISPIIVDVSDAQQQTEADAPAVVATARIAPRIVAAEEV